MKHPLPVRVVAHEFTSEDLVAGNAVLNLANTATARDGPEPIDWLDGYPRLLEWASLASLISQAEHEALRLMAGNSRRKAATALQNARALREAIHSATHELAFGHESDGLDALQRFWKAAAGRARLSSADHRAVLEVEIGTSGLDLIVDRVALAAVTFLGDLPVDRLRLCAGDKCGWLFVDTSKAGRRRWCDMATCGNAAKSRRHQRRLRNDPSAIQFGGEAPPATDQEADR